MAQLNVAREPSMDEILASIRKIIENNEPGLAGAAQTFEDGTDDAIELTIDSEIDAAIFDTSDARSHMSSSGAESTSIGAEVPTSSSSPLSLADVAARVRAASERHASHYAAKEPTNHEQVGSAVDSPVITQRMAAVSFSKAPSAATESAPEGAPSRDLAEEPASMAAAPAAPAHLPSAEAAEEGDKTSGGAIVSPAVSRQVARAFDDLAHAVDYGPRRSFDEIAEAMLRPMLQEWLDDNLPTLVERLVREEIERVARGPRR
ncbi:PopZ family protein [Sinorhizobium fredii]|uniref:PopZ family protein n=1 Tax=Rhizobium fredii TaxID=380 RepID=UPI0005956194|nr:PopZ family protein [Sinorhizobium fredii]WOS64198.1 PopZ family protein [Sinorhizobium fredii GR64]